jgi:hypothetical protein
MRPNVASSCPRRWRLILLTAVLVLVSLGSGAISEAGARLPPLRECGHHGWIEAENRVGWTYELHDIVGAGMFNVTSRMTGCHAARRVALRALRATDGFETWNWNRWHCRFVRQRYEWSKIRCQAARGRTVQWVTAA